MDNQLEQIKKKIDIVDFIGSFISIKKAGRNFKANCPFHKEKTPSFVISPERQIWHCFGSCGDGGDIFKFLMKWENITFVESLKELAQKAGVTLKKFDFEDKVWKKKERMFNMNQLTAEYFSYILNKSKFGSKTLEYLSNRNIKTAIIKKFQLGYSPSSWDSLRFFLHKKGFEDEEILENGLVIKSDRSKYYDRFRGRLMFPLFDSRNNIVGFSGRSLDQKANEAKYINSPETTIYHKRETLYGINLAKEFIKNEKNVYIVEGEFDMISPYQAGYGNFVAIKGSALTSEQLMLLKKYTDKLTLTLDTDTAGIEAVKRGINEAEKMDFDIRVVKIDFAKDPDEAIKKDPIAFKKAITNPVPIYDFIIDTAKKQFPEDSAFSKKKIGDEVAPYIEKINNPIIKSHYIKKLSNLLEVTEESIIDLLEKLNKTKKTNNYESTIKVKNKEEREIILEKFLLSYIFQSDDIFKVATPIFKILSDNDFSILSYQKIVIIFNKLLNLYKDKINLNQIAKELPNEIKPVFDELCLFASQQSLNFDNVEKLIYEIKKISLKRKIGILLKEKEDNVDKKKELISLAQLLKEVEKTLLTL